MSDKPEILIYCDGAASPNPGTGGFGTIIFFKEQSKELSGSFPNTTNNRMELTAALAGLQVLNMPCKVTIRTDSQYLCNAFNKKWITNWKRKGWITSQGTPVLNKDLWEALIEQTQRHQVTWEWVKGHAGDENNNRCDQLAVAARKQYDEEHPK